MHKTTATTTIHTYSVENTMNNRAESGFEKLNKMEKVTFLNRFRSWLH